MTSFASIFRKFQSAEPDQKVLSFASLNKKLNHAPDVSKVSIEKPRATTVKIDFQSSSKKVIRNSGIKSSPLNENEKSLISSYLGNSIRDSSKKTYSPYFNKFKEFCKERNFVLNSAESISLFLISLAECSESKSGALLAKSAIKYHLKLENPSKKVLTDSYLVSKIAKSIVKKYAKPVKKAKTLSSLIIKDVVVSLLKSGDFKDERTANFLLLQYLLFSRFEEIASLEKANVVFLDSGDIQVHIPRAKNFDVWDSKCSYISKGSVFDPVSIIRSYMSKLGDSSLLFPNFRKGKNGKIVFKSDCVSYSNMLNLLRRALDDVGLAGKDFSLHSIRTGALSESANANVDQQILQRHGRWKSTSMVNHYHQLSMDKKLQATRSLAMYD